jgi:hypothetical protein
VSFAAITICVAFQRVFIFVVVVYFVVESVQKLLDTTSYTNSSFKLRRHLIIMQSGFW